ncbi:MAG: caspase family protein, partial [Ferruginibacter sp.]
MKKIKCLYFILMLICGMDFPVFAQNNNSASGKTYALIIGISQYQNTNIPRLNYADKDATLFAGWLKSKSGGAVPDYQVRLLIGEDASIAAIYNALDWLTKNVSENDQVYLYFSGHGDVEIDSSNISRGYLLAWNSPSNNYTNNAIRVEDINKLANTLSINNKAKVILITDACHSGKMAGDFFKGKQLTARNLQTVLNNEVRMASCAVDEEAAEGPAWGGGRGVFSYYLLQGLNGMANDKKNDTVTVKDLSSFLTSSFAADKDLAREKHKQHPVIDGNPYFPVAVVDSSARNIYKAAFAKKNAVSSNPPAGLQSLKSLGPQPVDYFIQILKSSDLESQIDFEQYINTLPEKIPGSIVEGCLFFYQSLQKKIDSLEVFKNELNNKRTKLYTDHYSTSKGFTKVISMQVDSLDLLISSFEKKISDLQTWEYILNTDSLNLLLDQVQKNKFLAARFNEKFIQAIHEKAQDMINAYLTGDIAELERRQYYYSGKRSYGSLIPTLHLAATLAPQNDYLFQILKTQYSYISGLANRLQMAISPKQDSLLNAAFKHQYKALQLEPYAAYIHNELGNLYMYKKNYDSAEYHFNIAVALAPTWAIPWSNRIRMNLALNKIDKAKEAIEIANSLQPDLAYVHVNAGLVMEKDGNWLAAESYYLNAIAQNNVHYLPFERLGNIYIKTGEYAKADYYLYETKKRKDQFAVNDKSFSMGIELGGANPGIRFQGEKLSCPVKPAGNNNQILPYTLLATALQNLNSPEANLDDVASTLKKVIQIKPGI